MPRIKDIFRRKLKEYIIYMKKARLAQTTWMEEQRVNLHAFKVLQQNHMETNPRKIGEKEINTIIDSQVFRNRKWMVLTVFRFLQFVGNPDVKRGPGGAYTINKIPIKWPPHQRINVDWLNDNEPDILREMADTPLEQLLIHLELDLGLRRIECRRLRLQDIKKGYLNILGKGRMGGKWRTIPMHPRTPMILQQYLDHRNQLIQKAHKKNQGWAVPDNLIIHEHNGLQPYGDTSIDKILKKLQNRINTVTQNIKFSNHTLRRTFGRTLWKASVPIETIARIMGHESTETTIQYLGIQMMDMQEAMQTVYQYTQRRRQ